jgi:hypothetical protein
MRMSTPIHRLMRRGARWHLVAETGESVSVDGFDAVALALPSPQALALLQDHTPLAATVARVGWEACWAVMLTVRRPLQVDFEAAFIDDDAAVRWAACDSSKPQRALVAGALQRWVLHATMAWSRQAFDWEPPQAAQALVKALSARLGVAIDTRALVGHRWRYATPTEPLAHPCLWDPAARLGAAGDWCGGPRIEGAYLSGLALAEAIAG